MRILRAISDLPWWMGLLIFLVGNLIIPFGSFGYIVGIIPCLFGCWIFSKLVKPDPYAEGGRAIMFLPLTILALWVLTPGPLSYVGLQFEFLTLYVLRIFFGVGCGFTAFQGFNK